MEMLQDVADRKRDHVTVDLDDLDEVWKSDLRASQALTVYSTKKHSAM